ncbi:MAG: tetratricopeptide repeat protein, partial [Anaerolineales bacterium]|nr:tetratricopeptide repeat protein [Anaerolineales bacterium]
MKTHQARAHALITQADDLRQRGKLEEALAAYREAIRLVPAFGTLNLVIGEMLFQHQRPAEAATAFRAVLALVPEHDQAWSRLGQCQLLQGQTEDAFVSFEKALALNRNDVEA